MPSLRAARRGGAATPAVGDGTTGGGLRRRMGAPGCTSTLRATTARRVFHPAFRLSTTLTRPLHRLAFPLSAVNAALTPFRHTFYPLDADKMMRAAQRITGLHDFGDDNGFEERYRATVASLNRIDWHFVGRASVRVNVLWSLTNRLRITHLLKLHPEVHDVELAPPVVILGLFRTGSTFLHNVMAADEQLRAGWMWEFGYPAGRKHDPLDDSEWRRRKCRRTLKLVDWVVPDQAEVHAVTADQLEEDFFLLEHDFSSMKFVVGFGDWQLGRDLLNENLEASYRYHRLQLQLLSLNQPKRPWLLKCPWHLWNLETLMKVYPDAKLIHTHRDVAKAIGSQCSLSSRISARMKCHEDLAEVGQFWVDYAKEGMRRGLAHRAGMPESRVYDLRLDDVRSNPGATLRRMYEHLDLPHSDGLCDTLTARSEEMPTLQSGVHEYSIETFGLTDDGVRSEFADYCERFGV